MHEKVNCWECFQCNEKNCPAYESDDPKCWLVSGTHCRNEIQGKFLEKVEMCLDCEPFKRNMDVDSVQATLEVVGRQFKEYRSMVDQRDRDLAF